jgi:muramidase (phage lysozyme)
MPAVGGNKRTGKRYDVIGIYRRNSDVFAMKRVYAFLRILRELETAGVDESKKYYELPYIRSVADQKLMHRSFTSTDYHPFDERSPDYKEATRLFGSLHSTAGAYQLVYTTYDETIKDYGWRPTFIPRAQDHHAIIRLQYRARKQKEPYERRSALGYIMRGDIEKAITQAGLAGEFSCLPGGVDKKIEMIALIKKFNEYI